MATTETVDFKKIQRQAKWNQFKTNMKEKVSNGLQAVYDHRYELLGAVVIIGGTVKSVNRMATNASEKRDQKRRVWDPSAGHYWRTKHELSNTEYLEMERIQKEYDCSKGKALELMGLLKR